MAISLGTAKEKAGEITRGTYRLMDLPTGQPETLATIIASGTQAGPTLLLTANIHGGEIAGIAVIHRLLESLDLSQLKGRVVCIPSLNPSGLRAATRSPQFEPVDPNRFWPDPNPNKEEKYDESDWLLEHTKRLRSPGPQEYAWKNLFQAFRDIAPDFHVDLHTFTANSIPFLICDRVYYSGEEEKEGQARFEKLESMLQAMGLSIVVEMPPQSHVLYNYHRTTSSAVLNGLKIPACTVELGATREILPEYRDATIQSLKNLMSWAGMVAEASKPLENIPIPQTEERHRFLQYPIAPISGILDTYKNRGESFQAGDCLAVIRSMDGRRLHEIQADFDGYIVAWHGGSAVYERQILGWVAAPDRMPMVIPWDSLTLK